MLFDLISWIESNQAVKPRSGLRSVIISNPKSLFFLNSTKIPTTNLKITFCPTSIWYQSRILWKRV